jgi:hypothetical protein
METPQWQFWTDWSVKALGTLATFLAVFVALFRSWLRHRIIPPRLELGLSSADGFQGLVYAFDPATGQATYQSSAIWYHVRVSDKARWSRVAGVRIEIAWDGWSTAGAAGSWIPFLPILPPGARSMCRTTRSRPARLQGPQPLRGCKSCTQFRRTVYASQFFGAKTLTRWAPEAIVRVRFASRSSGQ